MPILHFASATVSRSCLTLSTFPPAVHSSRLIANSKRQFACFLPFYTDFFNLAHYFCTSLASRCSINCFFFCFLFLQVCTCKLNEDVSRPLLGHDYRANWTCVSRFGWVNFSQNWFRDTVSVCRFDVNLVKIKGTWAMLARNRKRRSGPRCSCGFE